MGCVFAASQLDYHISDREYREVVSANLQLQFETQTIRGQQLKALTQKAKPYVFAEDFFLTLFEADAIAASKRLNRQDLPVIWICEPQQQFPSEESEAIGWKDRG